MQLCPKNRRIYQDDSPQVEIVFFSKIVLTCCDKNCSKGQLISKGNFSVFNSHKKMNLKMLIFALAYWGQKLFIRFLGELKKTKSPLVRSNNW